MAIPEQGPATLRNILEELEPPWDVHRVLSRARRWGAYVYVDGQNEPQPIEWALNQLQQYRSIDLLDRISLDESQALDLVCECLRESIENRKLHGCWLPEWRHVLSAEAGPWCPLFGILPSPPDAYPASVIGRAIDVIRNARALLGVSPDEYSELTEPKFLERWGFPPVPDSSSLTDDFVDTCRLVAYSGFSHVLQYAQHYTKGFAYLNDDEVTIGLDNVKPEFLASLSRDAIIKSPATTRLKEAVRNLTDMQCLAVLATREGCWALEDALTSTLTDATADADTWRHYRQAEGLLRLAVAAEASELRPDSARGRKIKAAAAQGAKARATGFTPEQEQWREAARNILDGRRIRKPSMRELARDVAKVLHPDLPESEWERLAEHRRRWLKDL